MHRRRERGSQRWRPPPVQFLFAISDARPLVGQADDSAQACARWMGVRGKGPDTQIAPWYLLVYVGICLE